MLLTDDNYFSPEAMMEYMSYSQYKDFAGTMGKKGCEAMAMAKLRGDYKDEVTNEMLIGSYIDSYFSGTLPAFRTAHPEIFLKDGVTLSSGFRRAVEVIERIERDKYFMLYMSGEKQVIFTADLFGCKWKCKIDSLNRERYITDLKIMKSIRESFWVKDIGKMPFVQFWGYDIQAYIYQTITTLNIGSRLPPFVAAASKELVPDIEIIAFLQSDLDDTASLIAANMPRILKVKAGLVEPDRCGQCNWCKFTKVLSKPVYFRELTETV